MKIKLTSSELLALRTPINHLCVAVMERAQSIGKDGILTSTDLLHRLTAVELLKFAEKYNASVRMLSSSGKASIKFDAPTGLAFLAAFYATDATDLHMSALSAALLAEITDKLAKAYAAPIITKP